MPDLDPSVLTNVLTRLKIMFRCAEIPQQIQQDLALKNFLTSDTTNSISIIYDSYSEKFFVNPSKEEGTIVILTKAKGPLTPENIRDNLDLLMSNSIAEVENVLCDTLRAQKNVSHDQTEDDCISDLIEMLRQDINSQTDFMKTFDETDCSDTKNIDEELSQWINLSKSKDSSIAKRAKEFVRRIEKLLPLVNDMDKMDINQQDAAFGQLLWQLDTLIDQRRTYKFVPQRSMNLLDIISNMLLHKARVDNDHQDMFDIDNTNMRLRMCMWKKLMDKYVKYVDNRSKIFPNEKSLIKPDLSSYGDHVKKLTAAIYLRGIFDELVRFCKIKSDSDTEQKLWKFNEKRKVNKMSAKDERNYFFKEFGQKLVDILEYVKETYQSELNQNPEKTLTNLKAWINVINFKKSHETVVEIKNILKDKNEEFQSIWNRELQEASNIDEHANIHKTIDLLRRWYKVKIRFDEFHEAYILLADNISEEDHQKWKDLAQQIDKFAIERCTYWQNEYMTLKDQDMQKFAEVQGKRMDYEITKDKLILCPTSYPMEKFVSESREIEHCGCYRLLNKDIKEMLKTAKQFRTYNLLIKQLAISFNNLRTNFYSNYIELIAEDKLVQDFMKLFASKGTNQLVFDNIEDITKYTEELKVALQALRERITKIRDTHTYVIASIEKLRNFEFIENFNYWQQITIECCNKLNNLVSAENKKSVEPILTDFYENLYKILVTRIKETLSNFDVEMKKIKCKIYFDKNQLKPEMSIVKISHIWQDHVDSLTTKPKSLDPTPTWVNISEKISEECLQELEFAREIIKQNVEVAVEFLEDPKELKLYLDIHEDSEVIRNGNLSTIDEWEKLISQVKLRKMMLDGHRAEIEKGKIIFLISTFKEDYEKSVMFIFEEITNGMRDNINSDVSLQEGFILNSGQLFKSKASTIDELAQIQKEYVVVKQKYDEYEKRLRELDEKSKVLSDFGGMAITTLNLPNLRRKWENFAIKLTSFDHVLSGSGETIKKELLRKLAESGNAIDKFYMKISQFDISNVAKMNHEEEKIFSGKLKDIKKQWDDLQLTLGPILASADELELDLSDMKNLQQIRDYFKGPFASWSVYFDFCTDLEKMESEEWLTFKSQLYDFSVFTKKWADLSEGKTEQAYCLIGNQCETYKLIYPALKAMVGEGFERGHWASMIQLLEYPKTMTIDKLKFSDILLKEKAIIERIEDFKFLMARALGEVTLKEAINELQIWCDDTNFILKEYFDQQGQRLFIIKEWQEILTSVSDNQVLLQSMKDSKYSDSFKDQIESFEQKIGGLDEALMKMNIVQRKWVYLEPVFGRGALPAEQGRFTRMDDEFRTVLQTIEREPKVVTLNIIPGINDTLDMLTDQLERCQKALNSFLEDKRNSFPRFYFLGDDDLLEILGQSTNTSVILTHLKKLFGGINVIDIHENNPEDKSVTAMISSLKEKVKLNNSVQITKEIENWLNALTTEMIETLKSILQQVSQNKDINWEFPSQLICLAEELKFSNMVATNLSAKALVGVKQTFQDKLGSLTTQKSQLSDLEQSKCKSLILETIHDIAVLDLLISNECSNISDWEWFKQLKYEWDRNSKGVNICMGKSCFEYTFEYQGNPSKLVHTPLTDKCYLTLTQGMMMGYGGNPYGPAGTGKTESVKALGQCFGRQVLVFNCDESIDYKSMGRIFMGLVKCGAWGCFDEFNRQLEEQLSAISQQIQVIQYAIQHGQGKIELIGLETEVSKNSGIFVTMNPAGKGYGGRSKLPDNLKQLFRPVAMSLPDFELIAETLLYAEGFRSATQLAKKIVTLFTLSKQLLTKQQHYDWGLRAIKPILIVGGALIQEALKGKNEALDESTDAEILIKAIRVNTMSKLLFIDTKRFEGLLKDIFVGITFNDGGYQELTMNIKFTISEMKLVEIEKQILKIKQFYEATKQRMGVILVGPCGCGKTTIWKILKESLKKMKQEVKFHALNPKAVNRTFQLGYMNHDTRDFQDGILTSISRIVVKEPENINSWIICDGDIDPEWIEALNSVLDDNHLLTQPNGERISFSDNVNFIFETHDLRFASPATISRMGMMFLSNEDVNTKGLVDQWIKNLPEDKQQFMITMFDKYWEKIVAILTKNENNMVVETTKVGSIKNMFSYLKHVTNEELFQFRILQGICCNIHSEKWPDLMKEVNTVFGKEVSFDNIVNQEGKLEPISFDPSNQKIVLTEDSIPCIRTIKTMGKIEMIKCMIRNNEPFIVSGPEGCGKEMIIQEGLNSFRNEIRIREAKLFCNSQIQAKQVINKLYEFCNKGTFAGGRILKPKDCNRLILFLKDVNLPIPDKYNTTQAISLLQQIQTYRGFYDENLEYIHLDDKIQLICTMNPVVAFGRYKISTRCTANTRIANFSAVDLKEMSSIYSILTENYFRKYQLPDNLTTNKGIISGVSNFQTELFRNVEKNFVAQKWVHYVFTPKGVTRILEGLKSYRIRNEEDLAMALVVKSNEIYRNKLATITDRNSFDKMLGEILIKEVKTSSSKINDPNYVATKLTINSENLTADMFETSDPRRKNLENKKTEENKGPKGKKKQDQDGQESGPLCQLNVGKISLVEKSLLMKTIEDGLETYERDHGELKIYLSMENVAQLTNYEHILCSSVGNILSCGISGHGRMTVAKLAAHLLGLDFQTFYTTKGYSLREFKRDFKRILEIVGIQNKPMCLYLEDQHFDDDENMDQLNSFLSSKDIPGLFKSEEIETTLGQGPAEDLKKEFMKGTIYECFQMRVSKNLKIIISLDNSSKNFKEKISANPALLKNTQVVWNMDWSEDSLRSYAKYELENISDKKLGPQAENTNLINGFIKIHNSTKMPFEKFFTLIATYKKILEGKLGSSGTQDSHQKNGLQKITEANKLVDQMKETAQKQSVDIEKKQQKADAALEEITNAVEEASIQKSEAEKLKKFLSAEESKIKDKKTTVTDQLAQITPLIESAKASVKSISKTNLDELKSYKMAPGPVIDVFTALLRLMGQYDNSWSAIKKFQGQRSIIEQILEFDAREVKTENRIDVEKWIKSHEKSFEKATIYHVSQAAGPLADYVKAMVKLSEIMNKISPLENELKAVEEKLTDSRTRLIECEEKVVKQDKNVNEYKIQFSRMTSEVQGLQKSYDKVKDTLLRAGNLLEKLVDERHRWKDQLENIEKEFMNLPIDSQLCAGFSTYLSECDEKRRQYFVNGWSRIMGGRKIDFCKFSYTESVFLKWKSEGLPSDSLSLENTIIYFTSPKVPLIIDPSSKVLDWIKHRLSTEKNFESIFQGHAKFTMHLDLALRFGKILLVEEVSQLETMLYPVLRKDIQKIGPRSVIQIGEKVIDYNESFSIVLVSRDATQVEELHPKAKGLVQVINYSVTKSGLENQLLSTIINHEKPDLETKKSELLQKEESMKIELASCEKQLLEELVKSEGNILENESLIMTLEESKSKAIEISKALEQSMIIQTTIDKERDTFRDLASLGADIYLITADLWKINNMYRFSLNSYLKIFENNLDLPRKQEGNNTEQAINSLGTQLKFLTLDSVCKGLFKKDRLTFALYMVYNQNKSMFLKGEWEYFIGASGESASVAAPSWCPEHQSQKFGSLSANFPTLVQAADLSRKEWANWFKSANCDSSFPDVKLTDFQKVLLVQVFRPEKLETCQSGFVKRNFNNIENFTSNFSFKSIFEQESSPNTPILFIVSNGSDPSRELEEFAAKAIGRDKFIQMSLGGNQNEQALKLLKLAAENGQWIFLKNQHLVPGFLSIFEKELMAITKHDDFRVWLTTEESEKFPAILLESCFKVSFETPPGVKQNIERAYSLIEQDYLTKNESRPEMTFVLTYFHGIISERRRYIPQGWSKFYEFSFADFIAALKLAETLEGEAQESKLKTYIGLLELAVYGGRVDTISDNIVLKAYQEYYFSDSLLTGRKSINETDSISVTKSSNISEQLKVIEKLPQEDAPYLFGLSNKADISVQKYNVAEIINSLKKFKQADASGIKFDREQWKADLAPIIKQYKSLYTKLSQSGAPTVKEEELLTDNPLNGFVLSEIRNGFISVRHLGEQFKRIFGILKGELALDEETQKICISLIMMKTPVDWLSIWEGPENPSEWLNIFFRKLISLKSWADIAKSGSGTFTGSNLNQDDLFNPETFLNAQKQATSRKLQVSIDKLKLVAAFDSREIKSENVLKISNLLQQGSNFKDNKLSEGELEDGKEFIPLPVVYVAFIKEDEAEPYSR